MLTQLIVSLDREPARISEVDAKGNVMQIYDVQCSQPSEADPRSSYLRQNLEVSQGFEILFLLTTMHSLLEGVEGAVVVCDVTDEESIQIASRYIRNAELTDVFFF